MKNKLTLSSIFQLSVVSLSIALAGCSSDDDDSNAVTEGQIFGPYSTGSISESNFVYFDLDTASVVELTEEEAATDTSWDVAFKRTNVYLNANNASTPVSVYDTANNADFWDSEGAAVVSAFTAATPDSELEDYTAVTAADIPADDNMYTNDVTEKALDGFYNYDFTTHAVTAASDKTFVVKNGDTFSTFSVSELVQDGFAASDITLSVSYDFADAQDIALNAATECGDASNVYVDFATGSAVAATAAHDLVLTCSASGFDFALDLADGATAYLDTTGAIADADTANTYAAYGYFNTNEYTTTAFSALNWYAYGIEGNHKLWSKYGVYVIKTETSHFKFQITSYYNEAGESGNYSFRADELVAE